jgi:NAD/NADP transhydrogenase beta subunit
MMTLIALALVTASFPLVVRYAGGGFHAELLFGLGGGYRTLNNNMLDYCRPAGGEFRCDLSYIMCKAMNRAFFNVILGGFEAVKAR